MIYGELVSSWFERNVKGTRIILRTIGVELHVWWHHAYAFPISTYLFPTRHSTASDLRGILIFLPKAFRIQRPKISFVCCHRSKELPCHEYLYWWRFCIEAKNVVAWVIALLQAQGRPSKNPAQEALNDQAVLMSMAFLSSVSRRWCPILCSGWMILGVLETQLILCLVGWEI